MVCKPQRSLFLVIDQRRANIQDFLDIAKRVKLRAPDIRTAVLDINVTNSELPGDAWAKPALTISMNPGMRVRPLRGRLMCSRPLDKIEQAKILSGVGISVPHCELFRPGMEFPKSLWGDFVLLKPANLSRTSHGECIQIFRRERLSAMRLSDFPKDHPIQREPMIAQKFIDTGERPNKFRALVFCGEVLYVQHTVLQSPRPALTAPDFELETAVVSTGGGELEYHYGDYPDIIEFSKRAASPFTGIPLLGLDIIRDEQSGKLYALETNAGGNVWHFSSRWWAPHREKHPEAAERMHHQLNAFETAAQALVRATRKLAA